MKACHLESTVDSKTSARLALLITALLVVSVLSICAFAFGLPAAALMLCGMLFWALAAGFYASPRTRAVADMQQLIRSQREEIESLLDRYRVLTDNLAAAIVIRDSGGKVAYCSPYTEVLTGYALAEIYGCDADFFLKIIHEDDRDKFLRSLKVADQGEAFQLRYRFYHKTGIEMWAETRTMPILDENGSLSSSLSITLDITGLIRRQRQVEEKNRDLEDFSYMISHDLKSPLFTIRGMLTVIEEDFGGTLEPGLKESLGHIGTAVRRLENLVSGVLEYSRITSREDHEEPVSVSTILNELREESAPRLQEAQAVFELDGALPMVLGDRLKIYQIFSNLVENAIKYRCPQRPLRIEASMLPSRTDRFAKVSIKDNGLGIPAGKLDAIFRPFQRAHGKEIEGSGIGLACVKKLLEKLGGEIEVISKEGEGSQFIVTLRSGWKHSGADKSQ